MHRFIRSVRPLFAAVAACLALQPGVAGATIVEFQTNMGNFKVNLYDNGAPQTVANFLSYVSNGAYTSSITHRSVANFVIQGGSPSANEYQGDGPFTRDELGPVSHWRGTVGVSTRGRDTGDGQIFVNLVDNVSLDHEYTVLGRVTSGMDVVDRVLEGTVIERAEVRFGG